VTRNELIAKVALDLVRDHHNREREGTLRFCMVGLEASIVCSIAKAVLADPDLQGKISVKIAPLFDPGSSLPEQTRSEESITHWRHCPLPPSYRGVLFAASQKELQRNDKSIEKVTKIETDTLRSRYSSWLQSVGLTDSILSEDSRKHVIAAIQSADRTHAARTIEMFSDFVLGIAEPILAGRQTVTKAIDEALPHIRLPRKSGEFDRIPQAKRDAVNEWSKIFRRLNRRIRPLLVRENDQGDLIPAEDLNKNYKELRADCTDRECSTIKNFLDADVRHEHWSDAQRDLANLDWPRVSPLFHGVNKRSTPKSLGECTLEFFEQWYADILGDDERQILSPPFPREPSDELRQFFESYREHLAQDKQLSRAWEKFIYRNPQTYRDFLAGLVSAVHGLRSRVRDAYIDERKIVVRIRIPRNEEMRFWTAKNSNVMRYFAFRYRGLQQLLGENICLDFGRLESNYVPHIVHELTRCTSRSREARSLKFEVILDPEGANEKLMFHWEMPVDTIATAMPTDLLFVANIEAESALLSTAHIARQPVSAKGGIQRIDLDNMNSIRDVHGTNEGWLVSPNDDSGDRSEAFLSNLNDLAEQLGKDEANSVKTAFGCFVKEYTVAIRDWVKGSAGISSEAIFRQAEAFGRLLESLLEHANNDRARESMWQEMLRLGVANFTGGSPAAIVTPWHPLRLLEIGVKARQASKLINKVLGASEGDVFRADLLVEQVQLDLLSIYYPEVCVTVTDDRPTLIAETATSFDYTLAEPPLRSKRPEGDDSMEVNPGIAAKAFGDIGGQYLKLLPHERSNFSIVLYNSESKALPSALASELASKLEKESELQCDLLLTHSDAGRIRRIYEQQNVAAGESESSVVASEATRNFLSRLRVGFLDESDLEKKDGDRPADLVALQDVVARNAELAWKKGSHNSQLDPREHYPGRWSRRRPVSDLDSGTAVYLTCPAQPQVGQIYLNALHGFLDGDNAATEDVIPAREINLRDPRLRETFERTHKIGEWVVNFDQLVDRRMLAKNKISVIRHVRKQHLDRNIVVSTTSRPKLLQVLLNNRLAKLDPALVTGTVKDKIMALLIDRANELSGQVVMRAARFGHYTNELIGIILSMERLRAEIGGESLPTGWFFLDDCATWFGQSEEQIADIMAIAPRSENGQPVLRVVISEAKFVRSAGHQNHARKSAKQLQETVERIRRAIDPAQNRIDRDIWLHRIGDFMIESIAPFDAATMNGMDLHQWSQKVRQDKIPIQLLGFSHVFVHDDEESVDAVGLVPLQENVKHCFKEIIDKRGVVKALRSLATSPHDARQPDESSGERWSGAIVSSRKEVTDTSSSPENLERVVMPATPNVQDPSSADREGASRSDIASAATNSISDSNPDSSSHDLSRSEQPATEESVSAKVPKELLTRWPSRELARWVSDGKLPGHEDADEKNWLDMTVKALQKALRGYDMTAEFIDARLTPNAARVRLRGSDDLTVPKVEKRRQELLTSHAIDVINVMAAPMEIVIMVARPNRKVLRLRDLWRQRDIPLDVPRNNSSLLLGMRESDGELLYLNVGKEFGGQQPHGPHTLIAGETGSGKGVLVQCLLLDICATNAPESARIQMIDPKSGIDFPWLRRMPHLDGDLITGQDAATLAFETLVAEMERRNKLLAAAGVTKLSHYNQKVGLADRLPRIWLFHDELADWMMIKEYRESVERNASRLGVKARAAGINLVLVTQRPDRDALPMQLRANLTNRLVLKVADKRNSVLVLDESGAERLLGRGHLAAKLSGEGKFVLAQVPFADEKEIEELSRIIESSWPTEGGITASRGA